MAAQFLELHVVTRRSRYEIVPLLRDAIVSAGGWVTDYREFSNKMVCANFEIEEVHCQELLSGLQAADCVLGPDTVQALAQVPRDGKRTCIGTLEITLLHDEPDQKTHVPAVPG